MSYYDIDAILTDAQVSDVAPSKPRDRLLTVLLRNCHAHSNWRFQDLDSSKEIQANLYVSMFSLVLNH
jgi:hypothetical protein